MKLSLAFHYATLQHTAIDNIAHQVTSYLQKTVTNSTCSSNSLTIQLKLQTPLTSCAKCKDNLHGIKKEKHYKK